MSEEELVIIDILTRPARELSPEERAEVKKVARELLATLKDLIVINWRQKLYGSVTIQTQHRRRSRQGAATGLFARAIQTEVHGGFSTFLRKLQRQRRQRLRGSELTTDRRQSHT